MSLLRVAPTGLISAANQATPDPGGGSPDSIANLKLWLDAGNSGSVHDTAGLVDQWDDLSGNSKHFPQTGANRPTTGTRTIGGRNGLDFDGSSDLMGELAVGENYITQPFTVYWVAQTDTIAATNRIISSSGTGTRWFTFYGTSAGGWAGSSVSGGTPSTSVADQVTMVFNNTSSLVRVNGTQVATGTVGTGATDANWTIGRDGTSGDSYFNGIIGSILVYTGAHDTSTSEIVEAYLQTQWSTP